MSLKKGNRLKSLSLCDDFPLRSPRSKSVISSKKLEDTCKTMKYIDDNIIGKGVAFLGPYGRRKGKTILISDNYFFFFICIKIVK